MRRLNEAREAIQTVYLICPSTVQMSTADEECAEDGATGWSESSLTARTIRTIAWSQIGGGAVLALYLVQRYVQPLGHRSDEPAVEHSEVRRLAAFYFLAFQKLCLFIGQSVAPGNLLVFTQQLAVAFYNIILCRLLAVKATPSLAKNGTA